MSTILREKTLYLFLIVACLLVLLYFALAVFTPGHAVAFSVPTVIYPHS